MSAASAEPRQRATRTMTTSDTPQRWFPLPPVMDRTVTSAVLTSVSACPDRLALRDSDVDLTYAQLDDAARRIATALAKLGVRRGSLVVTMMNNHADNVIVWLALSYLAAVSVPVNTAYVGSSLQHIFADTQAQVAVVDDEYLDAVTEANDVAGRVEQFLVRGAPGAGRASRTSWPSLAALHAESEPREPETVQAWELHSVMYTSGTTSKPKGVLVPHALTYTRAAIYQESAGLDKRVELSTLPLFHVVGQCRGVLGPLILRGTSVLRPRFSASQFWEDCRRYGATDAILMGAMARFLMLQPESEGDRDHSMRYIHSAGGDLTEFPSRFGVAVSSGYGMTEIGTVAHTDDVTPGNCGRIHHEYDYQLVDNEDNVVPTGSAGELVMRSTVPWTFSPGYLNQPEATVESWRNLWFHTGDLFTSDADGSLAFVGRKKSVIRRRGENISPAHVESELAKHPIVRECAVIGVSSTDGEEEVLAFVAPHANGDADPASLLKFLIDRLPYYMIPRYVVFRTELPKTPTHKVDVGALRALAGSERWWDREAAGIRVSRSGFSQG